MDVIDTLPLASSKQVKRRVKAFADDHVPAVLAASDEGATPVAVVAALTTAPELAEFAPVEPVSVEAAPVEPALVAPPVAAPADSHEDVMDTQTTIEQPADPRAMFTDLNSRARGAMEKGQQMFEEMNAFGKGNMEAVVESSKIAAKGFETLGQDAAEFARRQVEGATQAMKTLGTTKSPTEFMKLQSDFARSMFDTMVAETSRSTEKMIKLANDIAQPISNRVAVAAEKAKLAA